MSLEIKTRKRVKNFVQKITVEMVPDTQKCQATKRPETYQGL